MMSSISGKKGWGPQILRYGIAGAAALGTHLLVLVVLVEFVGAPKVLSSLIGFLAAIPVNYILQHRFVFSVSSGHRKFLTRYLLVTLTMALMNTVLFSVLVFADVIPYVAAQILVTGVVFLANFVVNRIYTFGT